MVLLVFGGVILALLSLFLSARAIFSQRHLAVQATLLSSPFKSLAVGILAALFGFGVFVGLQSTGVPALALISMAIAAVGLLAVLFGLATVASITGQRVLALRNRESSAFSETSVGTLFLVTMAAVPILGWFLIGPVAALLGLGAVVISAMRRGVGGPTVVQRP